MPLPRLPWLDLVLALLAAGLILAAGSAGLMGLGLTATALLLTLPVLWAASRSNANIGAGVALAISVAFNYFLLPPRHSFRIDGATHVVTFLVFLAVALVAGGFAAGLRARQDEAARRAEGSQLESDFLSEIALATSRADLDARALAFLQQRFGDARLFSQAELAAQTSGLAPLDAAAAAWAIAHDAVTGHASEVMPGADFRFLSFGRGSADGLALATTRPLPPDATLLQRIAGHWGHARDHLDTLAERQRRQEAEARDRTRRALLAALGHDFRTPLTVLKEGLARLPGAAASGLPGAVERLRRLGENLLASARLDAGLPLALEPVDLVDTIAEVRAFVEQQAGSIALDVQLPDTLPLVRAEPVMLVHLVGNIVENALRHARSRVSFAASADAQHVDLRIADDGPGVPEGQAEVIFEPFVSGPDGNARRASSGSGLGLAIARDLALAMGAELALERVGGTGGAVFRLRLPIAPERDDPP